MQTELTVAICTADREKILSAAIDRIAELAPAGGWELIVVNNAPTDKTREVVSRASGRGLPAKYIHLPESNMGNARNAAIRGAAGRTLAYVDDDSLIGKTWFPSILDGFAALPEPTVGQTGPVSLGLPAGGLPSWCAPIVAQSAFSGQDCGAVARDLCYPECPIGNNMAFRKSFLDRSGGFSPMLRVYDEHYVCWPAQWKGMSFRYDPAMSSVHTVPEGRLARTAILGKMRVAGGAYQLLLDTLPRNRLKPSRHGMWPEIVRAAAGRCLALASGSGVRAFTYRCVLQFNISRAVFLLTGRRTLEYLTDLRRPSEPAGESAR